MQPSPYTPGQVAREVLGRGEQLAQVDERLTYLAELRRLIGRIRVDTGPRGVGKTSLLREVQRRADARRIVTIWVTGGGEETLTRALALQIEERSRSWGKKARSRLARPVEQLKISAGVPGVAGVQATLRPQGAERLASLKSLVIEGTRAALDEGSRGLILLIDEIQDADPTSLRALAVTWQDLQAEQPDLPTGVFAAGLPETPEVIAAAATFSERFAYRHLERLSADASRLAIVKPAADRGVRWQEDAVEMVVAQTAGYPYTLQLFGEATWATAGYPDPGAVLDLSHVRLGQTQVDEDLQGLFRARWNKSTETEKQFLTAMAAAADGSEPVERSVIAALLGRESRALSMARASLIDKGHIAPTGRGRLEFTIPGFETFVRRQQLGHVLQQEVLHRLLAEREQPRELPPTPPKTPGSSSW
jgi:hypothetical protein